MWLVLVAIGVFVAFEVATRPRRHRVVMVDLTGLVTRRRR